MFLEIRIMHLKTGQIVSILYEFIRWVIVNTCFTSISFIFFLLFSVSLGTHSLFLFCTVPCRMIATTLYKRMSHRLDSLLRKGAKERSACCFCCFWIVYLLARQTSSICIYTPNLEIRRLIFGRFPLVSNLWLKS